MCLDLPKKEADGCQWVVSSEERYKGKLAA